MNWIKDEVGRSIRTMEQLEQKLRDELRLLPEGYMKVKHGKDGQVRCYHVTSDMQGKNNEKYISLKKEQELIGELAQKQYIRKLLSEVMRERDVLSRFYGEYNPDKKYMVYSTLRNERKKYVSPRIESVQMKVDNWVNTKYEPSSMYIENLIFETDRGEMVRSKSEVIIANYLYSCSDKYYYRYECPLYLEKDGIVIYPDFMIISKNSGKVYYLEHFGKMDDLEYANKFVKKINLYAKNDIRLGENLIMTVESSLYPLNPALAKQIIENQVV